MNKIEQNLRNSEIIHNLQIDAYTEKRKNSGTEKSEKSKTSSPKNHREDLCPVSIYLLPALVSRGCGVFGLGLRV